MKKIVALVISIILGAGLVQAQFPMVVENGSLEMRINKVDGNKLFGFVSVEISVRSNDKDIEQTYSMGEENGNVYAAFAIVGDNNDYIHIGYSYDKDITADIWVKIGSFGFFVDTAVTEFTTLRFGLKPEKYNNEYTWFDFKNVPIEWNERPPHQSMDIKAEPLLPNGSQYVAATNLLNTGMAVSAIGDAQDGYLAVVFFSTKKLNWDKCELLDESGMRYELKSRDIYYMREFFRPKELNVTIKGEEYILYIIYFSFDKKQQLLKYVHLKGYNHEYTYKDIPIQWITPKKKSTGSKSNSTTHKPAPQKKTGSR